MEQAKERCRQVVIKATNRFQGKMTQPKDVILAATRELALDLANHCAEAMSA